MIGSCAKGPVGRLVLPGLIGLALLVTACTGSEAVSGSGATQAFARVQELASIGTLREAFNADAGATRLILLVSPT